MKNGKGKIEGIEITTFKIKGCTLAEFIKANASINKWLQKQSGFQSRRIAEKDDGTVVDMLIWDSVEEGTDAMNRIIAETSDSKVHSLIDQGTVSWNMYPVHHTVDRQ
jgi:hypothetical protein